MPATLTHRFTVDEYYHMAETGILKPGARVELIEGEIVDMMPIGPFHSGSVYQLAEIFTLHSQNRWLVAVQGPLRLDKNNEPEPDLMLLHPRKGGYKRTHPGRDDVFLVIEVADSSLAHDQTTKLPLYARFGIEEVWILNVPQKQLEIYRAPNFLGYESKIIFHEGKAAPARFPDAEVDVAELLSGG